MYNKIPLLAEVNQQLPKLLNVSGYTPKPVLLTLRKADILNHCYTYVNFSHISFVVSATTSRQIFSNL